MERYIGMDVHAESCSFCVLGARGKEVQRDVVETNGQALVQYLRQFSGRLHPCYEESEWAGWLWELLSHHTAAVAVFRGERWSRWMASRLLEQAAAPPFSSKTVVPPTLELPWMRRLSW